HGRHQALNQVFLNALTVDLVADGMQDVALGGPVIPIGSAPLFVAKQPVPDVVGFANIKGFQEKGPPPPDEDIDAAYPCRRHLRLRQHATELVTAAAFAAPCVFVEEEHGRAPVALGAEARPRIVNVALTHCARFGAERACDSMVLDALPALSMRE